MVKCKTTLFFVLLFFPCICLKQMELEIISSIEITAYVKWNNLFAWNSLEINDTYRSFVATFIFTVSAKSCISTQNEAAEDSCDTLKGPKFVSINLTHLDTKRAFLGTCNISSNLNMLVISFLIIKPWMDYIFSYLMPLVLLNSVFLLPKHILEENELNWFTDGEHSLVPAYIFLK